MRKRTQYLFRAHKVRGMNTVAKMLLCTLADQANDKGESWHAHESLAELCGCNRRSVIRHLEYLEKEGFIQITRRTSSGIKTSNLYTLNLHSLPDVTESHIDMSEGHIDVTLSPPRCDSESKQCDRESHKTPIKHPVKLYGGGSTRSTSLEDDLNDTTWAR